MRRAATAICALLLCLAAPAGATPAAASGDGAVRAPGLRSAASIERDRFGVPHLRTRNRHDLYLLQGWVHAGDRLFQMDVLRRQASGTLAELLGPAAIPSDVQLRTLGLRRAAKRSLGAISDRGRRALDAYAQGVNAWARSHSLPPEYGALDLTFFKPWSALDSAAVGKLLAFGLSFDAQQDIELTQVLLRYQAAGAQAGFDGTALFFQDLFRSQPFDPAATLPDAGAGRANATRARGEAAAQRAAAALEPARARRLRGLVDGYLAKTTEVPLLRRLGEPRAAGSNEWAVSGRLTADGAPLLANDPHLSLDQPSTFYPVHLASRGIDAIGSGFAGVPGVVVGHNRHVAWGATVNPMDDTDVFMERIRFTFRSPSFLATVHEGELEPIIPVPQLFFTNNPGSGRDNNITLVPPSAEVPPVALIVPRRNNGPIVQLDLASRTALSIQYTGFSGTREIDAFLAFDEARGIDDFRRGLRFFDVGNQNFAYADTAGNIAYFTSAELPLREDLEAGRIDGLPPFFVRDGTGGNEWLPVRRRHPGQAIPYEILPPDEMPQTVNPPAGFFVNANNDPTGNTLDNDPFSERRPGGGILYLNPGYDPGMRAGRVTERIRAELAGDGTISFADMQAIQADVILRDAELFAPVLAAAHERGLASDDPTLRQLAADPAVTAAIERLAGWDGSTPTGIPQGYDAADRDGRLSPPDAAEVRASTAATIYAVWRGELIRQAVDARLQPLGVPLPDDQRALTGIRHLLETFDQTGGVGASGIDFFAVPGVPDAADRRDVILLRSLQSALERLAGPGFAAAFGGSRDLDDYRWGLLHRVTLDHPLDGPFSVPPGAGAFPPPLPNLPGIPTDGGFQTVDASSHDARADGSGDFRFGGGPANRFVGELAPAGPRAVTSIPGGTSAIPGSDRYLNLLPSWLTNDTFPLIDSGGSSEHGSPPKAPPAGS